MNTAKFSGNGSDTTKSSSKEGGSDSSGKTKVYSPPTMQQGNTTFGELVMNNQNSSIKDTKNVIECIKQKIEEETKGDKY